MKVFINSVELENFKSYEEYTVLNFKDSNTIYGESRTGKTTWLDAIIWILSGTDYKGKSETVEFGTYGMDPTDVTLASMDITILEDDGSTTDLTLKRTYQKETAKASHKNVKCFINDVEFGARNFEKELERLIMPAKAMVYQLTPFSFLQKTTGEKKKELLNIFDNLTFDDIVAEKEEFEQIRKYVANTDKMDAVKKTLNGKISTETSSVERLSEQIRDTKKQLGGISTKGDQTALTERLTAISEQIDNVKEINQLYDDKESSIKALNNQISYLEEDCETIMAEYSTKKNNYNLLIIEAEEELTKLKEEANKKLSSLPTECSLCGTPYKQDEVKDAYNKLADRYESLIKEQEQEIEELQGEKDSFSRKPYEDRVAEKKEQILEVQKDIEVAEDELVSMQYLDLAKLLTEHNEISTQLQDFNTVTTLEDLRDKYMAQLKVAKTNLKELNKELRLVNEYVKFKMETVSDNINKFSDVVRIQLFDYNKAGDTLIDKFRIYYKNDKEIEIPEDNCSGGEIIALGSELLKIIEKRFDITVPLIVDKAESTTLDLRDDTQIIRTVVVDGINEAWISYDGMKTGNVIR